MTYSFKFNFYTFSKLLSVKMLSWSFLLIGAYVRPVNFLSPKSDHQISPCYVNAL